MFANGTTLTIATNAITNLTNISGPGMTADVIDVSSHGSANKYREFVQGLRDGGEIEVEGNFNMASAGHIITAFEATTLQACVITFPTTPATTWTFSGIVTGFSTEAPHDDKITYSATIKVSGKPTLAQAGP
jgi:predicted secreted protein